MLTDGALLTLLKERFQGKCRQLKPFIKLFVMNAANYNWYVFYTRLNAEKSVYNELMNRHYIMLFDGIKQYACIDIDEESLIKTS